jgi:hypothetical protein
MSVVLALSPASMILAPGASRLFLPYGSSATNIAWSSTKPTVATVDKNGLVTAVGEGVAEIKAAAQVPPAYPNIYGVVLVTRHAGEPEPARPKDIQTYAGAAPQPSVAYAAGSPWAEFERKWLEWADRHWFEEGAGDGKYDIISVNYYDRAAAYFSQWARCGNVEYLRRAEAITTVYRAYVTGALGVVDAHNMQPDCLALGNMAAKQALGRVADYYARGNWMGILGDTGPNRGNRVQARWLHTMLAAWAFNVPSLRDVEWLPWLRAGVDVVLSTQSPDGAWRFPDFCNHVLPFQMSMVTDVLSRYYDLVDQRPEVLDSIRRAANIMWETCWLPDAVHPITKEVIPTLAYLSGDCATGGRTPAWDVANLVCNTFAWLSVKLGDPTYMTKADKLFAGAVKGGFWEGHKQFNQICNSTALRYLALRFSTPR